MCYVDDVMLGSPVKLYYVDSARCVLNALNEHRWTINTDKGIWLYDEVQFLGIRVSAEGIQLGRGILMKFIDLKRPRNKQE